MHAAANDPSQQEPTPDSPPVSPAQWPSHPEIERREPRNLLLMAAHQIVFRVGWIFKTESVIMPAFLDAVSGAGWLRGWMPLLNRCGQSVPPVFLADRLRAARLKKRFLSAFILLMSLPFAVLSTACLFSDWQRSGWMAGLFLVLYGTFFVFNGLYHVSFGTVQGKLIRPRRRGLLLLVATFWGTVPAMLAAWLLLRHWLDRPDGGFGYLFAVTTVCFFVSGLTVLLLYEPADDRPKRPSTRPWDCLRETVAALQGDANLRRLVLVAMLFGSGLIIFPHYQALAREELGLSGQHLMVWVITQNASVGGFSLFVGPLADLWGNRLTLRTLIFGSAVCPLLAISLTWLDGTGAGLYWLVFIPLGTAPLVLRILANYTLETCEPAEHPRYLSTVNLCLAVPMVLSPLVGWAVDVVGFAAVFLSASALIFLGGCLTFRLDEPRHRAEDDELTPLETAGEE